MPEDVTSLVEIHAQPALVFSKMTVVEELGRPFEIELHAVSSHPIEQPELLLAQPVGLSLLQADGHARRHFHGLASQISLEGMAGRRFAYRLVLKPWMWLLTQRSDIRIFQNKAVDTIVREILQSYSGDFRFDLSASYEPREYCVQYRETDFQFVSRLLEQEGMYYYFEHSTDKHTLVLTDHVSSHEPYPGAAKIQFRHALLDREVNDCVSEWRVVSELRPTKSTLRDFDFQKPALDLTQSGSVGQRHGSAELEIYDYPGQYETPSAGGRRAAVRAEEQQSLQERIAGAGDTRVIACGHRFKLMDPPPHGKDEYIVASCQISVAAAGVESGRQDAHFACAFTAFDTRRVFRPARITPRPVVAGPQTATVVGPAGDELYTDKHGRVKLHFHWDRLGKRDENSSCWVRVAQPLAGDGFGFIALPRIGQEVVVEFLEGDPDRPLVTGRVYNGMHSPPYALPDHKTVSTVKSRSTPGGDGNAFNELRFEDKAGQEYIWLQAQKDFFLEVENDRHEHIGHDEVRIVERNVQEHVKGDVQRTIAGNVQEKVNGNAALTIEQDSASEVKGQYGLKVTGDLAIQTSAGASLKTAANWDAKVGANVGFDADANIHIKAGANVVIEAGAMITLKSGGASVVIGPANVSITGAMVQINSGGAPGAGCGASPQTPKHAQAPEPPELAKDQLTHVKG